MPHQEPLGPFCQSCSMPLEKPGDFGMSQWGYRINDYCRHCYHDGAFTEPDITLEQMIDRCVGIMAQRGIMPEVNARTLLTEVMPRMKRWCPAVPRESLVLTGGRKFMAGDEEC